MQKTITDPSAFLDSLPGEARELMSRLDRVVSDTMKGHPRVLWEGKFWGGTNQTIIGYGSLSTTNSRGKTVEWFMVGLALQKNYVSLYVNAVDGGQYVAEKYAQQLGKVTVGKASISFNTLEEVNLPTLKKVLRAARDQLDEGRS